MHSADLTTTLPVPVPLDLAATLAPLNRGTGDPTVRLTPAGVWLALRADSDSTRPHQPATLFLATPASRTQPTELKVSVWTDGDTQLAEEIAAQIPRLVGLDEAALNGWAEFDELMESRGQSLPNQVRQAYRDNPGLRLPATGQVSEQLMRVILEQKVTHDQARAGWRWLVRKYGSPAPGPAGQPGSQPPMMVAPLPDDVAAIPSFEWHRGWVQPQLAATMVGVMRRASAIDRLAASTTTTQGLADLGNRLQSLPGLGPWTIAETLQRTHGAADLVSVGDYHVAHHVGEALTGSRTDDAGMLELLEPWRGHRHRIVKLIYASGIRFSRFGPKLAPTDFRDF